MAIVLGRVDILQGRILMFVDCTNLKTVEEMIRMQVWSRDFRVI